MSVKSGKGLGQRVRRILGQSARGVVRHRTIFAAGFGLALVLAVMTVLPSTAGLRLQLSLGSALVLVALGVLALTLGVNAELTRFSVGLRQAIQAQASSALAREREWVVRHDGLAQRLDGVLAVREKEWATRHDELGKRHDDLAQRLDSLLAAQKQLAMGAQGQATAAAALDQASKVLAREVTALRTGLSQTQTNSVSLDLVSVLRTTLPILLTSNVAPRGPSSYEHGHSLLMSVLADRERSTPGWLSGRTLVEVGTTRELAPAQKSTEKLALFTALMDMRFVTVDMDPENTAHAKSILRFLNPSSEAVTALGEEYLFRESVPLEVVYLDAFDFDHGHHSAARQQRYRQFLNTQIEDEACWRMHLLCAEAIVQRMPAGGIVVLDDTWTDAAGDFDGKGKLAMPLLLSSGFEVVARTTMTIALTRGGVPAVEPSSN